VARELARTATAQHGQKLGRRIVVAALACGTAATAAVTVTASVACAIGRGSTHRAAAASGKGGQLGGGRDEVLAAGARQQVRQSRDELLDDARARIVARPAVGALQISGKRGQRGEGKEKAES